MISSATAGTGISSDWLTRAEATDYRATDRYPEIVAYCRRLEEASPYVRVETIGRSPEGRDILALVVLQRRFDGHYERRKLFSDSVQYGAQHLTKLP